MLKLIYDVKCGFKTLYMTEKNREFDLTPVIDTINDADLDEDIKPCKLTEKDLYEKYKNKPDLLLEEVFNGVEDLIYENTVLDFSKSYFRDICYKDPKKAFVPSYFKMYNLRLSLTPDDTEQATTLKAKDVLELLNISRMTLTNYVKRGLIKVTQTHEGGNYLYDAESVYALKNNLEKALLEKLERDYGQKIKEEIKNAIAAGRNIL